MGIFQRFKYKVSPEAYKALERSKLATQDIPEPVVKLFDMVASYTMTSIERIAYLVNAVEYVCENNIEGAIVECGVWRGGSMMAIASVLLEQNECDRELYMFDTFEGMTEPTENDTNHDNVPAEVILEHEADQKKKGRNFWAYASLEEVKENFSKIRYPESRIHFVKGRVENTIPNQAPEKIAILRLDTDWYESTKHELEHLYSRISPAGVLIIDDYGWWQGAKKATDDFFAKQDFKPLLHRIDFTGRAMIKIGS